MEPVIVISPGHGGADCANRGKNGYIEADGTLEMAKAFRDELSHYECSVLMVRETDKTVSLGDRGRFAAANGAFVFISLHTNGGGGTGPEVYYSIDLPEDKIVAEKVSAAIAQEFGLRNRGAKIKESTNYPGEDYLTEIDVAQDNGVPHILLIEPMFHDNINEEAILQRPDTMQRIAKTVVPVISECYDIKRRTIEVVEVNNNNLEKRVEAIENKIKGIIDILSA